MIWYNNPLQMLDIGRFYLANPYLFDALIFFTIFLGVSAMVFKSHFGGRAGKAVAIAVSLALTIPLVLWEYYSGWYIGMAQNLFFAAFVFGAIMILLLYGLFRQMLGWERRCAFGAAFLIGYPAVEAMFGYPLEDITMQHPTFGLIVAVLFLSSAIMLIICLIGAFRGEGGAAPGGGGGVAGAGAAPAPGHYPMGRRPRTAEEAVQEKVLQQVEQRLATQSLQESIEGVVSLIHQFDKNGRDFVRILAAIEQGHADYRRSGAEMPSELSQAYEALVEQAKILGKNIDYIHSGLDDLNKKKDDLQHLAEKQGKALGEYVEEFADAMASIDARFIDFQNKIKQMEEAS